MEVDRVAADEDGLGVPCGVGGDELQDIAQNTNQAVVATRFTEKFYDGLAWTYESREF